MNYGDPKVSMSNLTGGSPCETIDITNVLDDEDYEFEPDSNELISGYHLLEFDKDIILNETQENELAKTFSYNDHKELTELDLLWFFLIKSISMKSLLNTSFDKHRWFTSRNLGLLSNHTYAILEAVEIRYGRNLEKKERLLKLRNPNGDEYSWKGEWSFNSRKWLDLSEQTKKYYNITCDPMIGEFFISLNDYARYFDILDVAHVNLNSFYDFEIAEKHQYQIEWQMVSFYDIWMENNNAGTANEFYWSNAQYLIQVYENPSELNKLTSIIVTLMQPYSIKARHENNGKYNNTFAPIRFKIYSVKLDKYKIDQKVMSKRLFKKNELKLFDSSCCYIDQQEVTKKFYLPKGYYVILPSTSTTSRNVNYFIRMFYQKYSAYFWSELIFK